VTLRGASMGGFVRKVIAHPMIWPLVLFGTSGLAFMVANIVWARSLSTTTYALVSLWLVIWNSALRLAPFGAHLEVVRNDGVVTRATIGHVWRTSLGTGLVTGIAAGMIYDLTVAVGIALAVATAAGGVVTYASAALQARRSYLSSLFVLHSFNYLTLLVAIATIVTDTIDFSSIVMAMTICTLFILWYSSGALARLRSATGEGEGGASLRKLWPLLVITASYELMMTSDRLVTPLMLSLDELANLSVLLALVGPPFRLMEMSVAYTVLPELKSAGDSDRISKMIWHHGLMAAVLTGLASLGLLALLGPLTDVLFGEKFRSPLSLVAAEIVAGLVRVAHSFANAAATALVPEAKLPQVAFYGTVGSVVLVAGAVAGAKWGLQGVIYGTICGWLFRSVVYGVMVRHALRVLRRA
jgi:O-antigen/teichoic acid export membrane protein